MVGINTKYFIKDCFTVTMFYSRLSPLTSYTFYEGAVEATEYCTQVIKGDNYKKVYHYHLYNDKSEDIGTDGTNLPYASTTVHRNILFNGYNKYNSEKLSDVIYLGNPGELVTDEMGQLAFYYSVPYNTTNSTFKLTKINTSRESTTELYLKDPRGLSSVRTSIYALNRYKHNIDDVVVL